MTRILPIPGNFNTKPCRRLVLEPILSNLNGKNAGNVQYFCFFRGPAAVLCGFTA
jgi:hypothetical protein